MNIIDTIFGTMSATQNHLANVENSLFEVVKVPLIASVPNGTPAIYKAPNETFGIYKSNGGDCLGVMKKQFVAMQPKEFYDNIIATVHEFGADLDLNTLRFKEYCGGSKIEFSIKMHPMSFKNNKGVNDMTNLEVTFSTSYDGSKSNTISLYTERLVCTNGMVANKLQGTLKGRNTKGGKDKILSYASELAQIINGANQFKEKMEALDKITLSKREIEIFKRDLFGNNEATLLANNKDAKANGKAYGILNSFETAMLNTYNEFRTNPITIEEFKQNQFIEMTAFEVLQSVTHYTNHIAKVKSDTDENIRFGSGFKTNAKAQEILFELV